MCIRDRGVDVLPFPDAALVQILVATHPAELARCSRLAFCLDVLPQVQSGEQIRCGIPEPGVQLVGMLAVLCRTFPRVADRERGGDHLGLSLIHISEPTRRTPISYAV